MANVGFKLGSQAVANEMLIHHDQYDITEGSFYLTSDTHRLYIGAVPTTTNRDGDVTPHPEDGVHLYALNEGITTVPNLNGLPIFTAGTPEEQAAIGNFYYVESENILCIYGGTKSGNGWIQVNQNTDTNITGASCTVNQDGTITYSIVDSNNKTMEASFKFVVGDGLTTEIDSTTNTVTIKGDTYTLGLNAADVAETKFDVTLTSKNTDNDSKITLEAGEGVSFTPNAEGTGLKISATESKSIEEVEVRNGIATNNTEGFSVVLTDKNKKEIEGTFNPKIKYGVNTFETVPFDKGIATLNAYTAKEIEKILRELNAMRYRGTLGIGGSGASELTYTQGAGYRFMLADGITEVPVSIGDMFVCKTPITAKGETYPAGTILICESTDETETTDGIIDPTKLRIQSIESTFDTDTTYTLAPNQDGDGIVLRSKDSGEFGELKFIEGDDISATFLTTESIPGKPITELTLAHKKTARNDTHSEEEVSQLSGNTLTLPIITSITTDEQGHITSVNIQNYIVRDTISHVDKVDNTTTAYKTDSGDSVGVISVQVTTKTDANQTAQAADFLTISSSSLEITDNDSYAATKNGTQREEGISINMVWGEF